MPQPRHVCYVIAGNRTSSIRARTTPGAPEAASTPPRCSLRGHRRLPPPPKKPQDFQKAPKCRQSPNLRSRTRTRTRPASCTAGVLQGGAEAPRKYWRVKPSAQSSILLRNHSGSSHRAFLLLAAPRPDQYSQDGAWPRPEVVENAGH